MNTGRVPLTGHARTFALRHLRRNAPEDAAGASFVLAPLGARPRPLSGCDRVALSAAPRQAPDLLIALPCFGASPCVCLCCPSPEPPGSPIRGRLPQGDHHGQQLTHPPGACPCPAHRNAWSLVEPLAVPTRNITWVPRSGEPCGLTAEGTLLLQRAGSMPGQPSNLLVHSPADDEALPSKLRRPSIEELI